MIETTGDAVVASFSSANEGANAGIDIQRALAAHNAQAAGGDEPIVARIGVHSGDATTRGSEPFGRVVGIAARVAGLAPGRQVIVTGAARAALVQSDIPVLLHVRTTLPGVGNEEFGLYRIGWDRRGSSRQGTTDEIATPGALDDTTAEIPPASTTRSARAPAKADGAAASAPIASPAAADVLAKAVVTGGVGQWGLASGRMPASPGRAPAPPVARPPSATRGARRGSGNLGVGMSFAARAKAAREAHSRAAAARAPGANEVDWRERCDELIAALETTLLEKGILRGDDEAIDRLMDTAVRQADRGQHEQAGRFFTLARDRIAQTVVDRPFVNAKVARVEVLLARCDPPRIAELTPLVDDAKRQASARDLASANDTLNRALAAIVRA